ncbi:gliding motility lipoprotein GldB [Aquimarina agarivorans]|uniref:gliding motility lipoprotein GldB n=1 Tax=Aquimarina agarivorans TaxID=980584 RepID=UPI000498018E|nr:gliding motility lipoprotein GldB [Aquimarina agarivorans]
MKYPIFFKLFLLSLGNLFFFSCKNGYQIPAEISSIDVEVSIERFDQDFMNLNENKLVTLKKTYPFLFPTGFEDKFWLKKSKDTLQQELVREVKNVFPDLNNLKSDLTLFYKHLIYYYPSIKVPRIVTLISDVDYKNNIILRKELLLLSLDTYLGKEHYFYEDISKYIKDDFEPSQLLPNIAMAYARKVIPRADGRDLLSQMILFGKRRLLLHKLLPKEDLNTILGYTENEMNWLKENEAFIWRYFIEKEMLFNTDKDLLPRFIYPAPFSKFYLTIDQQAPDRVGEYIGYQIVLAFMEENNVSLQQLMEIDSKTIFEKSRYKPKK